MLENALTAAPMPLSLVPVEAAALLAACEAGATLLGAEDDVLLPLQPPNATATVTTSAATAAMRLNLGSEAAIAHLTSWNGQLRRVSCLPSERVAKPSETVLEGVSVQSHAHMAIVWLHDGEVECHWQGWQPRAVRQRACVEQAGNPSPQLRAFPSV